MKAFALFLVLLILPFAYSDEPNGKADLILTNAAIWTVDSKLPQAEAVAIRDDRILAVGSSGEILKFKTKTTLAGVN
jgi:hypothetical protein